MPKDNKGLNFGVQFNINDCDIHWGPTRRYVEIVRDLVDRGIRIDNVGVQMHIFNPDYEHRIPEILIFNSPGSKSRSVPTAFTAPPIRTNLSTLKPCFRHLAGT